MDLVAENPSLWTLAGGAVQAQTAFLVPFGRLQEPKIADFELKIGNLPDREEPPDVAGGRRIEQPDPRIILPMKIQLLGQEKLKVWRWKIAS